MKITYNGDSLPANFSFTLDLSQDGYDVHIEVRRSDTINTEDFDDLPTIDYEDDPILSSCYRRDDY